MQNNEPDELHGPDELQTDVNEVSSTPYQSPIPQDMVNCLYTCHVCMLHVIVHNYVSCGMSD